VKLNVVWKNSLLKSRLVALPQTATMEVERPCTDWRCCTDWRHCTGWTV